MMLKIWFGNLETHFAAGACDRRVGCSYFGKNVYCGSGHESDDWLYIVSGGLDETMCGTRRHEGV